MFDQAQNLRQMVSRHKGTKLITITSGKGGVGKSALALNMAIALTRRGKQVLIIDGDFGLANIDVMLGAICEFDLSHVLSGEKRVEEVISAGKYGVNMISGGNGVDDLLRMSEVQIRGILDSLIKLEEMADYIIFDTGAGVNDIVLRLALASNSTIVVTTPEPTAIMDAYALVKTIHRTNEHPPIQLVVNKAQNIKEAVGTLESFTRIAQKYIDVDIERLGYMLFDPVVSTSIKRQVPFMVSYPRSMVANNLDFLVNSFLETPTGANGGGVVEFINRLLRKRRNQA